jgi:hypothetical protein
MRVLMPFLRIILREKLQNEGMRSRFEIQTLIRHMKTVKLYANTDRILRDRFPKICANASMEKEIHGTLSGKWRTSERSSQSLILLKDSCIAVH